MLLHIWGFSFARKNVKICEFWSCDPDPDNDEDRRTFWYSKNFDFLSNISEISYHLIQNQLIRWANKKQDI